MLLIFSKPVFIRHLWQLKTAVFLHWCLICAVQLHREREKAKRIKSLVLKIQSALCPKCAAQTAHYSVNVRLQDPYSQLLYFLRNLNMDPLSQSVCFWQDFQNSLMFVGKASSFASLGQAQATLVLAGKGLPKTNSLANWAHS